MGNDRNVAVVGQGYVGLPLAAAAAEAGCVVVGLDLDEGKVAALNDGQSPVGDVDDAELARVIAAGRYCASTDFSHVAGADVIVLCVPTPYRDDAPDLSFVRAAAERVGERLRPGALVVLESTTYPGTTEDVLAPILEQASGLVAERDFDLAFSPERIDPGNEEFGLRNTPKIVGGVGERATERACAFYSTFVDEVIPVSGPKAAEMAKLLENTFRHINIALVNELAILSRDLDVDIWEVINAAASKPFGFMPFYPGPGVGGHCIPVDPMYLSWRVRQFGGAAKFIDLARDVNAAMPMYCVSRVQELLNERERAVKGSRVLVLGVSYKPDIPDMRESPAVAVIERLRQRGALVEYHDPFVPVLTLDSGEVMKSVSLDEERLSSAECVVILTAHTSIDYAEVVEFARLVYDTRNVTASDAAHVHLL